MEPERNVWILKGHTHVNVDQDFTEVIWESVKVSHTL